MAPQLTHQEIQELLGAFAVDAVDPDEAAAVDLHLAECPRCRDEVAGYREAATLLSFSGKGAPDGTWAKIAASLEETPPPLTIDAPISLARRRNQRRVFAGLTAVAAAAVGLLGVRIAQQDHRIDQLAAIADRHGLEQAAAAAAISPGARPVHLTSNDGTRVVDAVVTRSGQGYLINARLPGLKRDQTYQLWGIIGAQTISLGVLGQEPAVTPFKAVGPLSALAITAERASGAVAPTSVPVVQGFLAPA